MQKRRHQADVQRDPLFQLTDMVVLVAGAGGGLGSAISKEFCARGAKLVLTDLERERAESVAADCGNSGNVGADALDIRDECAVDKAVSETFERHGRLDGLINAAGILRIAPLTQMAEAEFNDTIATNLTGAFYLTRAAGKVMGQQGSGRILHLASVSSLVANSDYVAYATSKAALSQMIRVAARELAPKGVTVNAIGPSIVDTQLAAPVLSDPEKRARFISQIPMGRLCEPQDILAAAVLLMAPGGSYITGQTIFVDGGRTLV